MPLGPVMVDLAGTALTDAERERLRHPLVGGVILFSRNYRAPEQLAQLTAEIHALREPQLLVGVDQEGGRVQRFQAGFTTLPPMRQLGQIFDENSKRALRLAENIGWLMGAELRSVGVDMSFAPVLDIDRGLNEVIGNRAFHSSPDVVARLGLALARGMRRAGMVAVGKHFPGHGGVQADSHTTLVIDTREYVDIAHADLRPFMRLVGSGLEGIMGAHVVYARVDGKPADLSRIWLRDVLRTRLGFQGAIFSDDLSMEGVKTAGDIVERTRLALDAGCDMVLVCNDSTGADRVLRELRHEDDAVSQLRRIRLQGRPAPTRTQLAEERDYHDAVRVVHNLA